MSEYICETKNLILILIILSLLCFITGASLINGVMTISTPFAARIFLGESVSWKKAIASFFCVVGTFFIFNGLMTSGAQFLNDLNNKTVTSLSNNNTNHNTTILPHTTVPDTSWSYPNIISYDNTTQYGIDVKASKFVSRELVIGISACIVCGLTSTLTSILTKKLQPHVEDIFVLALYYNLVGIVMGLILMIIFERKKLNIPDDAENIIYFSIHATSKLISSFTWQIALYFGSAVACTLAINANLTFNAISEYILFPSTQPLGGGNWIELTGTVIVTIGVIICPLTELFMFCKTNGTDENEEQRGLIEQETNK